MIKQLLYFLITIPLTKLGAIAQLVEHLHGMQGVSGSTPLGSISFQGFEDYNLIKDERVNRRFTTRAFLKLRMEKT